MPHQPLNLKLPNVEATEKLGQLLSTLLSPGDFVALQGDLGAGKTALARSIIQSCQDRANASQDEVQSPTFTLVQSYEAGELLLTHYDFYRLENESEMIELGLDEALEDGCVLAEWPEKSGSYLPGERLEITLAMDGEGRKVALEGIQGWGARLEASISDGLFSSLECEN